MLLQKYEDVIPDLMVLAGPREELERNIPACTVLSVGIINPAAEILRKDLTALESLRMAAHDSLEKILELANKDLVGTLKTAVDPYEITKQTLMAIEEEKQQLDKLLAEQSNVIDRIKVSNTAFLASRKATPALKQREEVINRLEVAYQTYKTLLSNVVEGNKFYLDLVGLCEKLHKSVEEFLLSRKIEYNDIYRSIQDLASSLDKKKSAEKTPATSKVEREIADSATVSTFGSIDIHARRKSDAPAFPPAPAFQESQSAGGANYQGYDTSYQGQKYSQAPPQNYAPPQQQGYYQAPPPQQAYVPAPYQSPTPAPYSQPSYGGGPPGPYQQPSVPYGSQPGASYQQPGASYQQPGAPYQQPGASYQQPGASYQQPGASYQQPGAPYQQPGAPYQQGPPNGQPWTPGMPVQYGQPPQLPPRQ